MLSHWRCDRSLWSHDCRSWSGLLHRNLDMLLHRLLNRLLHRNLDMLLNRLLNRLLHWSWGRLSWSRLLLNHLLLRLWLDIGSCSICVNDGRDTMLVVGDGSHVSVLWFLLEILFRDRVSNSPGAGRRQREVDVAGVDLEVRCYLRWLIRLCHEVPIRVRTAGWRPAWLHPAERGLTIHRSGEALSELGRPASK